MLVLRHPQRNGGRIVNGTKVLPSMPTAPAARNVPWHISGAVATQSDAAAVLWAPLTSTTTHTHRPPFGPVWVRSCATSDTCAEANTPQPRI